MREREQEKEITCRVAIRPALGQTVGFPSPLSGRTPDCLALDICPKEKETLCLILNSFLKIAMVNTGYSAFC